MAYTAIDDPEAYFQVLTWTGNDATSRAFTFDGDTNMQPDLVWSKIRSQAYSNSLIDSVRGVTKWVSSNETGAESTSPSQGFLTSFDSDGFTVEDGSSAIANYNTNTDTYVAWCWKAGTSFSNDASATSIGTIDSSGSINSDAGFSICSYVGTGSNGTIKHGLSTVPEVIIMKNTGHDTNWGGYTTTTGELGEIRLNSTSAFVDDDTMWNDTAPTTSVFSVGTNYNTNHIDGRTYISYIFSSVQGFSSMGSYIGNGSADGPFIYTGFRPAFVLCKNTELAKSWFLLDNKRDTFNPVNNYLTPNRNNAEGADDSTVDTDFVSNGFKLRATNDGQNESGDTFIYMAFAEAPFVNSNGVPCNAR